MAGAVNDWGRVVRLREVGDPPLQLRLEADDGTRAALAKELDILGLERFTADLVIRPWLDGVELSGRLAATVTYECGVTLDPFDAEIDETILVRAVPSGSPHAQPPEGDLELDPEADDPPDILESDEIDPTAYVVEHLALSLDPFPRKPGVEFEAPEPEEPESPFAALKALKLKGEGE
jgi:uncharacterized metal-binding protein YceD (DUF177 family)